MTQLSSNWEVRPPCQAVIKPPPSIPPRAPPPLASTAAAAIDATGGRRYLYIERERRTALFARSANSAIERVSILIMVSPSLFYLMQAKLTACLPEETDYSN